MYLLIKTDDDLIPLTKCNMSIYEHNIHITSSDHNDIFNFLYKLKYENSVNKELHLITEKSLTVVKMCVFQDVKLINNIIHLNIIGDKIINYDNPEDYIRNKKMKKIINNISEKDI